VGLGTLLRGRMLCRDPVSHGGQKSYRLQVPDSMTDKDRDPFETNSASPQGSLVEIQPKHKGGGDTAG